MSEQKKTHRRRSKLDPYLDQLGKVPDAEIAVMAGVTPANVNAFRRRHGIEMVTAAAPAPEAAPEAECKPARDARPELEAPVVMSETVYRAAPGLNFSTLKHLATSPKAYKYQLDAPKTEPTSAQSLGTAIHMAILEPHKFWDTYAIREKVDGRTKEGKAYNERWEAENPGKIAIDQSTANLINAAFNAVNEDAEWKRVVSDGWGVEVRYEEPVFWSDPLFGACKGRPDVIRWDGARLTVLDLKTTSQRIDAHTVARVMGEWLIPLQLAFYARGMLTKLGLPVKDFALVDLKVTFVQTVAPFDAVTYTVSMSTKLTTLDMLEELGSLLSGCQKHNVWPGLPTGQVIDVPAYYLQVK